MNQAKASLPHSSPLPPAQQNRFSYVVDGQSYTVDSPDTAPLSTGKPQRLSTAQTDITFKQPWYGKGFCVHPFLEARPFSKVKQGIERSIARLARDEGAAIDDAFTLERYHHYVTQDDVHLRVATRTRDLFAADFDFPVLELMDDLRDLLNTPLTDKFPGTGETMHIIVRINRPGSGDYNPPHKDIYEHWDDFGSTLPFVNIWIPVAGVTARSSLPIVPGSHLLREDQLLRTTVSGPFGRNTYRVRTIASWAGSNVLHRAPVQGGQVLVFSSHLVHGFAVNAEPDTTRVALEFRLFSHAIT